MRKNHWSLLLGFFCASTFVQAQAPASNLYLFNLRKVTDTLFQCSAPRFLSAFNQKGYNNHPFFFSDDELYFSSQGMGQKQPDFYSLNLNANTRTRVTDSPDGEYSPRPLGDGQQFTAVRMEFPGKDTIQRLWQFPLNRSSEGRPVFNDLNNVGYYCWMSTREALLFLVDRPNQLVRVEVGSTKRETLASNVGRCIKKVLGGGAYFVQKSTTPNAPWKIMRWDPRVAPGRQISEVALTLPGSEDFALMNDGSFIMASGPVVYRLRPGLDKKWRKLADFSFYQIKRINRIELSPDNSKLVFAAN
jgi:hypothetical protein